MGRLGSAPAAGAGLGESACGLLRDSTIGNGGGNFSSCCRGVRALTTARRLWLGGQRGRVLRGSGFEGSVRPSEDHGERLKGVDTGPVSGLRDRLFFIFFHPKCVYHSRMSIVLPSTFERNFRRFIPGALSVAWMSSLGHFCACAAGASGATPGSISEVTVSLTVNWTKENGTKTSGGVATQSGTAVKASLGNKEFLQYLVDTKLLADTTVAGWKIVQARSLDFQAVNGLFAVKTGKAPVKVPDDILSLSTPNGWASDVYGEAETYSQTKKTGADFLSTLSIAGKYVGGISGTFPAGPFKGIKFKALGFTDGSFSSSYGASGEVSRTSHAYQKITSLVGAANPASASGLVGYQLPVLEGGVSVGASTAADVTAFKK